MMKDLAAMNQMNLEPFHFHLPGVYQKFDGQIIDEIYAALVP